MAKASNPKQYPVRRGSRRDRLLMETYRQMIWEGIVTSSDYDGDVAQAMTWDLGDDNAAMLVQPGIIKKYLRFIAYSDRSKSPTLTTIDGKAFAPPSTVDGVVGVYAGYLNWLNCDEAITDEIDERILLANAALSAGYLADAEKAKTDPNSLSEGVTNNEE